MPRSDRLRPLLLSCLMGAIVALTVGLGALTMLQGAQREGLPLLRHTTEAGAEAVGRAVAGQIERALDYGIPLQRVNGLDTYLHNIVQSLSLVSSIAVLDSDGKTVFATADSVQGPSFPLEVDGRQAGSVMIEIPPPFVAKGLSRLELALLVAALFAGLNAGYVTYLFLTHHFRAAELHLRSTFEQMNAGNFASTPQPGGRGIVVATFAALDRCFTPLRQAERRLDDATATVHGIDFDGSLRDRLATLLEPVTSISRAPAAIQGVTANETVSSSADGLALWPAALIIAAYAAASPLVANYAIDRQWALVPDAWWPSLPIIVDITAIAIAALLASRLGRSLRDFLGLLGLCAAALATAAIAFNHDYTPFLGLRALSGVGFGLTLAAAFAGAPAFGQIRTTWRLLIYSGAVAGPLLGGLLAEATGRRTAFIIIGAMLLAALGSLSGLRHLPTPLVTSRPPRPPITVALTTMGIMLGAAATWIPAYLGYDSYLAGGAALAGVGVLLILVLMLVRAPIVPAFGDTWALALGLGIGACLISLTGLRDWQAFVSAITLLAGMLVASLLVVKRQSLTQSPSEQGTQ